MHRATAGPLDGIRVRDITRGMPRAVASVLVADNGADVISVRPPLPAMAALPVLDRPPPRPATGASGRGPRPRCEGGGRTAAPMGKPFMNGTGPPRGSLWRTS